MYRIIVTLVTAAALYVSCGNPKNDSMDQEHKYTNNLIHETSPYLLQHAHNPVDWHPWNEETLELAKKEDKLLLISIGYAACHWCHVMEHESFEDSAVAAVMNEHFINVKVDREERPDVDQIYMNAVQLLTGRGGWPLNCVALPDGRPIWGGTYFPKENWMNALNQLSDLYANDREKAQDYAEKLTQGVQQSGLIALNEKPADFSLEELDLSIENWKSNMDVKNGGRPGAPKFPMPVNIEFLLRYGAQSEDQEILDYVNTTLTQMAYGGIFDQVGGGFARYSVDDHWHIPHFEKMLYDNAQLVSLYSLAFQATGNPLYKEIVEETTVFVERELYDGQGGFYSSLDADSEDEAGELEEGAFYVWTKEELQKLLGDDFELFAKYYNVNGYGKWEKDNYHLIRSVSDDSFCQENDLELEELQQKVATWKKVLLTEREKRSRPRLDDKILTSWNALMLRGYTQAYAVFGEEHYLKMALKNAHFIQRNMMQQDGGLFRNHKGGKSTLDAYLEDYAAVIEAFIALYEVTLDMGWLQSAKQLADYCYDHFYDDESKMFFFTSDREKSLISRKIETDDNVIPSSNATLAQSLFKLGHYFGNKHYQESASTLLNNMKANVVEYGAGAAKWLGLYANYLGDFYEIAVVGPKAKERIAEINRQYIPNKLVVGSVKESSLPLLEYKFSENETTIYVCIDGACKLPVTESEQALEQIEIAF